MITLTRTLTAGAGFALGALLLATPASAQSLGDLPETPELSLMASTMQVVGVTDVTITYSSPAARDRDIWGGLVPYGTMWRAGANAPTSITFEHDVMIGGETVPAGEYTLMIMPEEGSWTFVFNTDSAGRGAYTYNEAEDVARVTVTPEEAPFRERMLFLFDDTTNDRTHLTLEWAGMKAAVPIEVDTAALVEASMEETFASLWRPQYNAARYLLDAGTDLDRAAALMAQSIAIDENWWNTWFMARIEHERGENASAREYVERTLELGEGDSTFENFFRSDAEEALAEWPRR